VDRALLGKLGFEKTETHHHVYRLWLDGVLVARTYISHGGRELSRYHVSQMAKQVHLRTSEFVDAIHCPLSRENYERLLRERVLDDKDE
jgi:predicted deacetylase